MHKLLDQLLEASSQSDMQRRFEEVSGEIEERAPSALKVLEDGLFDATAANGPARQVSASAPHDQAWPERFIEEIRRREKVIRTFLNIDSVERLVGALCAETHEEWSTGRRYLTMDAFFEWKTTHQAREPETEESTEPAPMAA